MDKSYRKHLVLFFLVIIFGFVGWYLVHPSKNKFSHDIHQPLITFSNLIIKRYNQFGQLKQNLSSKNLVHDINNKKNIIQHPVFKVKKSNETWVIQADKAITYNNNDKIKLINHVIIRQLDKNNHTKSTIKTSKLWFHPNKNIVTTDENVNLIQKRIKISSQGMKVNLKKQTIELLNKARGQYAPSRT